MYSKIIEKYIRERERLRETERERGSRNIGYILIINLKAQRIHKWNNEK